MVRLFPSLEQYDGQWRLKSVADESNVNHEAIDPLGKRSQYEMADDGFEIACLRNWHMH
jgi:hypothetical protein